MGKRKLRITKPSKFEPAVHIPMLYELFSSGKSLAAFCVEADIAQSTFYYWLNSFPEFEEAYSKANMQAQLYWEELGMKNLNAKAFQFYIWSSTMRNRFYLSEKRKVRGKEIANAPTARDKYKILLQEVANGNLTSTELAQLVNAIFTGTKINKETELENKVAELEQYVQKQQVNNLNTE